jgi:hypothetical protein
MTGNKNKSPALPGFYSKKWGKQYGRFFEDD